MGRESGLAEGRAADLAEGRRDSLMIALQTKGTVSKGLSDKIGKQADLEVLNGWIALACQVSNIEEFERQISGDESEPI